MTKRAAELACAEARLSSDRHPDPHPLQRLTCTAVKQKEKKSGFPVGSLREIFTIALPFTHQRKEAVFLRTDLETKESPCTSSANSNDAAPAAAAKQGRAFTVLLALLALLPFTGVAPVQRPGMMFALLLLWSSVVLDTSSPAKVSVATRVTLISNEEPTIADRLVLLPIHACEARQPDLLGCIACCFGDCVLLQEKQQQTRNDWRH